MGPVIALAGGSGGLGRTIVEALIKDGRYTPVVLSRSTSAEVEAKLGARVFAADYTDISSLVKVLEENNVYAVISTVGSLMDFTPELNLIEAAGRSKMTKRFIPNIWSGVNYKAEHGAMHISQRQFTLFDALAKTSLEWAGIYLGVFLDYYAPGVPSHVSRFPLCVDVVDNIAGIPGAGDNLVGFTHTTDVAKYMVELLGLKEEWAHRYFIGADLKSWNDVLHTAEKIKGVKFKVSYDSHEKLERGEVTELPGHSFGFEAFGGGPESKAMVLGLLAQMGLFVDRQDMTEWRGPTSLPKMFPEVKTLSVEEALERSFGEK